jgi:DNA-binding transcriptional MerR regulator
MSKLLLIGQVTALSNVPIRTIRYYESLGLIESGDRTGGGFRQFDQNVLAVGSFGRLYLGGQEQDILAGSRAALAALENVNGREQPYAGAE